MENLSLPIEPKHDLWRPLFNRLKKNKKVVFWIVGLIIFLPLFYFLFLSAPRSFPSGAVVKIESGMGLRNVSLVLKEQNIIRSRAAFEFLVIILGGEKHIISSDYTFEKKVSIFGVAGQIFGNGYHTAPVVVTIPEGFDIDQIADTFVPKLANFNKAKFLLEAGNLEGYLFPDTYFFLTDANEQDVFNSMSNNFTKKINLILPQIVSSGKSEKDIIIMASIIEREAKGDTDRGVISGILWKRLSLGMSLQVDSVPETYKTKGLPDSPIDNPGLLAIKAAIYPQSSSYLYYLHDKDGNIHYAATFAEHEKNIVKYLGKEI